MTHISSTSPGRSFSSTRLHERSDLSHWRKRLGDKLQLLFAESLRIAHEAVEKVDRLIGQADLTLDAANVYTLSNHIDAMNRNERMLAALEARRNAGLREVDLHRESLARPFRRKLAQMNGEFQVVKDESGARSTRRAQGG
jgi:hypothetical protein